MLRPGRCARAAAAIYACSCRHGNTTNSGRDVIAAVCSFIILLPHHASVDRRAIVSMATCRRNDVLVGWQGLTGVSCLHV